MSRFTPSTTFRAPPAPSSHPTTTPAAQTTAAAASSHHHVPVRASSAAAATAATASQPALFTPAQSRTSQTAAATVKSKVSTTTSAAVTSTPFTPMFPPHAFLNNTTTHTHANTNTNTNHITSSETIQQNVTSPHAIYHHQTSNEMFAPHVMSTRTQALQTATALGLTGWSDSPSLTSYTDSTDKLPALPPHLRSTFGIKDVNNSLTEFSQWLNENIVVLRSMQKTAQKEKVVVDMMNQMKDRERERHTYKLTQKKYIDALSIELLKLNQHLNALMSSSYEPSVALRDPQRQVQSIQQPDLHPHIRAALQRGAEVHSQAGQQFNAAGAALVVPPEMQSAVIESLESMCADIQWFNSHDTSDKSINSVSLQSVLQTPSAGASSTTPTAGTISSPSSSGKDKKKGHPIESLVWTNSVGQYQDIVSDILLSISSASERLHSLHHALLATHESTGDLKQKHAQLYQTWKRNQYYLQQQQQQQQQQQPQQQF